jgi:hypothetical protein
MRDSIPPIHALLVWRQKPRVSLHIGKKEENSREKERRES